LFVYRQVLEIAGHLTSSQPCVIIITIIISAIYKAADRRSPIKKSDLGDFRTATLDYTDPNWLARDLMFLCRFPNNTNFN